MKICELATGNKCIEEWNVLPEVSPVLEHDIREEQTILDKNFALMTFNLNLRNHEPSELMVLNLATRQRLWIKGKELETKIRAKVSEPFDWQRYDITRTMMLETKVRRKTRIELKHRLVMFGGVRPNPARNIGTRCYHYLFDQLSRQLSRTRELTNHMLTY